jgi:superfamily II DNA or RNA helicase
MKLYAFQESNVATLVADPQKRWVLDETGLGKSVTAIAAARAWGAQRVLIVTLGMVRPGWVERLQEWWPERAAEVGVITVGRERKGLSKPAEARRAAAYAAPIQVVSYDLLGHVEQREWDLIVLDEIHVHVSFRSATSKALRDLFAANPLANKLGLTATLLSAEPKNAWNPLQLYWPDKWGKPRATGDPPYWFCNAFCERIENEWGVDWKGLNPANAAQFAEAIAAVSVRTLRSDVAHLLPPIDCSPLLVEASNRKTDAQVALDWVDIAAKESSHISLFTYFRESAAHYVAELRSLPRYKDVEISLITGAMTPEARHKELCRLRETPRGILVGTVDALGMGITLTAFKQYLLCELTTTANKLVQVIGRFSRLDGDGKTPSRGFVLVREGRDDDLITTLRRRLDDFNTLIKAGQGESALLDVLASPLQGEAFDRRLDDLIGTFRGDVDTSDDDEDAA